MFIFSYFFIFVSLQFPHCFTNEIKINKRRETTQIEKGERLKQLDEQRWPQLLYWPKPSSVDFIGSSPMFVRSFLLCNQTRRPPSLAMHQIYSGFPKVQEIGPTDFDWASSSFMWWKRWERTRLVSFWFCIVVSRSSLPIWTLFLLLLWHEKGIIKTIKWN